MGNAAPTPETYIPEPVGDTCPRCSNRLLDNRDQYGPFRYCVNCGYAKSDEPEKIESSMDAVMSGKVRRLRYHGKHPSRVGDIVINRYVRTTRVGTALWEPDCPVCGEQMSKQAGYITIHTQDLGETRYRCPDNHRIWISSEGTTWR